MRRVLLFPGQGSQSVGMARDLFEQSPRARQRLEEADEVLGFSLTRIMFEGPAEVLQETRHAQPAILAHSIAAWSQLDPDWQPASLAAAGHSLGEYSAYVAAGALVYADALRLVHRRGTLMHEAGQRNPGAMGAVLGADRQQVEAVCEETEGLVVPANFNSPNQIVISGEREAVGRALETLKARGAKRVVPLKVSGAFHSPLMQPAADGLRKAIENAEIRPAGFPVIANASATPVVEAEAIRESLVNQLLSPVLWEPTVRHLAAEGPAEYFEIGPGQVLKGLLRSTDRSLTCQSLGTAEEVLALTQVQ